MTEDELGKALEGTTDVSFRPFFSTRVLAKLERYETLPVIGKLLVNRIYLKRCMYAGTLCLLVLFGYSYYQEGSLSMDNLLGLGNFSDDELLNYLNPLI